MSSNSCKQSFSSSTVLRSASLRIYKNISKLRRFVRHPGWTADFVRRKILRSANGDKILIAVLGGGPYAIAGAILVEVASGLIIGFVI
jgi:hypothetical protein